MTKRPSALVLIARHFGIVFVIVFMISKFWNTVSGMNMFPFSIVIGVSVILTLLFTIVGWFVVTGGMEALHGNDPEYKNWKARGGRPYWDTLGWPINPNPPEDR